MRRNSLGRRANLLFWKNIAENYMKMKEFGPKGRRASLVPDPFASATTEETYIWEDFTSFKLMFHKGGP